MNRFIITTFLLFTALLNNNATSDILKIDPFTWYEFHSEIEEQLFNDFFVNHRKDYFGMFMAIDSNLTKIILDEKREIINGFITGLKDKKFQKATEIRKIKLIKKNIFKRFLSVYYLDSNFSDLISKGYYNDATAAALFVLILKELDISYQINLNHDKISLVSNPESLHYNIEINDPGNRMFNYDLRTKRSYINYLISKEKVDSTALSDIEYVFDNFFYINKQLSIEQLLGIQYIKYAELFLDNRNTQEAFNQLEKAYLLYPNENCSFLIHTALSSIINDINYSEKEDFKYLYKLVKYRSCNFTDEQIIAEFTKATNNLLISNGNVSHYNQLYVGFIKNVSDSALLNEISYIYNYEMGRFYLSNDNASLGNLYVDMALKLKPNNKNSVSLYIAALAVQILNKTPYEIHDIMTSQLEKYPFLIETNLYHGLLAETYLLLVIDFFENNNPIKGSHFLELFQQSYDHNPNLPIAKDLIARAYITGSVYYFKKGNIKKTKELLKKAHEYVPDSNEIILRLRSI